jgi:leucyl aminopeptidase
VIIARDLINTPPNDLYPASFAERARKLAEANGLEFEVLDEKALKRKGFGGILGVGSGSSRQPRLVRVAYKGPKAVKKIALVGKGITFDSGGISIKPAANMDQRGRRARLRGAGREAEVPARGRRAHPAGGEHAFGHLLPAG